jgi:hypothetical protein
MRENAYAIRQGPNAGHAAASCETSPLQFKW